MLTRGRPQFQTIIFVDRSPPLLTILASCLASFFLWHEYFRIARSSFFFGIQIDIFNILSGIYSGIRFRIPCRNLCGILCNMLFDIFLV